MAPDSTERICPNCQFRFQMSVTSGQQQVTCPECDAPVPLPEDPDLSAQQETYSISGAPTKVTPPSSDSDPSQTSLRTDDPTLHRWVCRIDDNEVGPVSYQQMRKLALAGTLNRKAQVKQADGDHWQDAGSIAGLFEPRRKKAKPVAPPESKPAFAEQAPYDDVPAIVVLYGRIIMIASAVIGFANVLGVLGMTVSRGEQMGVRIVLVLWGLAAFNSYVWFVCYKLGGGLMYGEKSAVQGLAVLMGVFFVAGIAIFVYAWPNQLTGIIVCASSLALFGPALIVAFQHKEVFQ